MCDLMVPKDAFAEPTDTLEITGDGVMNPTTFTLSQLQAMEQYQHVYSTINTWPTKRWYVGEGVKLRQLLALAGLKEDASLITFTSNDGYTVTLTVKELLKDKRYYFPHLKDNAASDGSMPGSPEGAIEVEPILALLSFEGSNEPANMNDMDAFLLMCGQRAVTEQTNNIFLKYVRKIEVLTIAPKKWDNPRANISSGAVSMGTLIELSNKRNDSDKIHYTTDGTTPTINSPIFNWSAKRWWAQRPDSLESINKPIEITNETNIKAITIGPGKEDSEVVTFSYQIGSANDVANQNRPSGPPTGISLDEDMINLKVGGTFELTAVVGPDNAADKRVTWSSSDTSVATIDNYGFVTVVRPGSAIITAKTVVGDFMANCMVVGVNDGVDSQNAVPIDLNLEENEVKELSVEQEVLEVNQQNLVEKEHKVDDSTSTNEEQKNSVEPEIPKAKLQYLVSKEVANVDPGKTNMSRQNDDRLAGCIYEMTVEIAPIQMVTNSLDIYMSIVFVFLFLSGAVRRYIEYMKEIPR